MTSEQITALAREIVNASNQVKGAYNVCRELLGYNTVANIDWNALPAEVIAGTNALPADISNALYAMEQVKGLWEGVGVAATNFGQSFEKLSSPLV